MMMFAFCLIPLLLAAPIASIPPPATFATTALSNTYTNQHHASSNHDPEALLETPHRNLPTRSVSTDDAVIVSPTYNFGHAFKVIQKLPPFSFFIDPTYIVRKMRDASPDTLYFIYKDENGVDQGFAIVDPNRLGNFLSMHVDVIVSTGNGVGQAIMKKIGEVLRDRVKEMARMETSDTIFGSVVLESVDVEPIIEWYKKLGFKPRPPYSLTMSRLVARALPDGRFSYRPLVRSSTSNQ